MHTERGIRQFYAKWSPGVLAFCCLLLDEGPDAERTVAKAFQAYLSRGLDIDLLPLPMLFPWNERDVLGLHGAMGLGDMAISELVEIPAREVLGIWMKTCSGCANC